MVNLNLQLFLYFYCHVFIEVRLIFTNDFLLMNDIASEHDAFLGEDTTVAVRISEKKSKEATNAENKIDR